MSPNVVRCRTAYTFAGLSVFLKDLNDSATMPRRYSPDTAQAEISGGRGNDVLVSSAAMGDSLSGDEGRDRLMGEGVTTICLAGPATTRSTAGQAATRSRQAPGTTS